MNNYFLKIINKYISFINFIANIFTLIIYFKYFNIIILNNQLLIIFIFILNSYFANILNIF